MLTAAPTSLDFRGLGRLLPTSVLPLLAGLAIVGLLVGIAVITHIALYAAAALVGLLGLYLFTRYPASVAYVALIWLVFEKGVGGHVPSLDSAISSAGDALLVFALVWTVIVNLIRRRSPILRFAQIGGGLFLFVLLNLVSAFLNAVPPSIALDGILSTVHSMIIFLVIINIGITAKNVHSFVYWTIGVMAVAALIGVLQAVPHSPFWVLGGERLAGTAGLIRVDGPFDHPNSNADYLALTAPLALMLFWRGDLPSKARRMIGAAAAAMLAAIVLTFAREAWLALPVGALLLGAVVERRLLKVVVYKAGPLLLALLLVAAPLADRLLQTAHGNLRFTLLRLSLPLIRSHLLFGVGPGRFGGHVALVTHTPLYAQYGLTEYFYGTGNQIDMFWTHLIAESGLLGTAAYLWTIAACFLIGRRAYLHATSPERKAIILGLLYAIPVAVFVSLVSATLEAGPGATLFWGLMGMLTVVAFDVQHSTRGAQWRGETSPTGAPIRGLEPGTLDLRRVPGGATS